MRKVNFTILLCFAVLLISSIAGANVTLTNNRTSFEALGTIDFNYGFDEWGVWFNYPGDQWTSHGVTYTNNPNVILGAITGLPTDGTPMMTSSTWGPVKGTIDQSGRYTLFGFDAGYIYNDDIGTAITIGTNIQNYIFNVDLVSVRNPIFYGFVTTSGEFFTTFNINPTDSFAMPGMDNVTLGDNGQHQMPEPATMFLLGSGLVVLAGFRKRFRKN